jgi:hypothetical protein
MLMMQTHLITNMGCYSGQGLPSVFTPQGTWSGWRETVTPPFAPPSTLCEPMQGLTAHGALSWVSGRARAPVASLLPVVPPLPLRGSVVVVPLAPLPWGKATSGSGDCASTPATKGKAGAGLVAS